MEAEFTALLSSFDRPSPLVDHEFGFHGAIRDMSVSVEQLEAGRDVLQRQSPLGFGPGQFAALQRLVHILRVIYGHLPRYSGMPEVSAALHEWTAEIGRIAGR